MVFEFCTQDQPGCVLRYPNLKHYSWGPIYKLRILGLEFQCVEMTLNSSREVIGIPSSISRANGLVLSLADQSS